MLAMAGLSLLKLRQQGARHFGEFALGRKPIHDLALTGDVLRPLTEVASHHLEFSFARVSHSAEHSACVG